MIDDLLVAMLNAVTLGEIDGAKSLLLSPQAYNKTMYDAMVTIHSTAVKPVTAIVMAIMFVLMLATTSTRAEGDQQLGVRIIAASMFKIAMVFIVAQNAVLILDALASIATTISTSASEIDVGVTSEEAELLGNQLRKDIEDEGTTEKAFLLVVLLIPWLLATVASILAVVLVFIRFLQMYLLTAFASLPLAFLGHEDTKNIGIGYLKGFATVALSGTVLVVAIKLYQALKGGWSAGIAEYDGSLVDYLTTNFGSFFIAPLVLIFMLFGANGIAKRLVGEG